MEGREKEGEEGIKTGLKDGGEENERMGLRRG